MTSPEPTPAEIEAAAREWCVMFGENPDETLHGGVTVGMAHEFEARALIALRAKDNAEAEARIAELEAALDAAANVMERIGAKMASCKNRPRHGVCGQTIDAMMRASDFTIPGGLIIELGDAEIEARAALAAAPVKRDV